MNIEIIDWENSVYRQMKKFERGAVAAGHLKPTFDTIATDMLRIERIIFSSQGRRGGGSWKRLAESTRIRKYPEWRILIDTGALHRSVTDLGAQYQVLVIDKEGIVFGTDRPWAFVHQYGDRRGHVPRRQFIDFTVRDTEKWKGMMMNALMRPFVAG